MERTIYGDGVMIAINNRFKCMRCGMRIKKGIPAVRFGSSGKYGFQNHTLCYECYKNWAIEINKNTIEDMIKTNKDCQEELKKAEKECTKALILDKMERERLKAEGKLRRNY